MSSPPTRPTWASRSTSPGRASTAGPSSSTTSPPRKRSTAARSSAILIDNDVEFSLPQIGGAPTVYGSAREAVEVAQASEAKVTAQFEALANAARDAKDNRTLQFVQWFIEEQVEEERTMAALLDLIDSGINLFQAEALLDGIAGE